MRNSIIALREAKGYSQLKLARLVSIGSGHMSLVEHGKAVPTIELGLRIARALGADPYEVFPDWQIIKKRRPPGGKHPDKYKASS